jgi:hypothetical protein
MMRLVLSGATIGFPGIGHARRLGRFAALLCCVALVGCGGSSFPSVTGKVTLGGAPLSSGRLLFHPTTDGPLGTAQVQADGTFVAHTGSQTGLPPGEYKVSVQPDISPMGPMVPEQFRNPATTTLSVTVVDGSNPEFELTLK